MNDVEVTVCIPTYNQVAYLCDCLESVRAQEFTDFRILVLDDCSTDSTCAFLKTVDDPRLAYVRNTKNLGVFMNWRQALWSADTEYVVIFQHDDIMLPRYLRTTVAALDRNPEAAFVFTLSGWIDESGRDLNYTHPRNPPPEGLVTGEYLLRYAVEGRDMFINPSGVLMRRSCVDAIGNFDCPHSYHTLDTNLYIRLAAQFPLIFINEVLCMNRRHSGQVSERVSATLPFASAAERIEALAYLLKLQKRGEVDLDWCAERLLHLARRASEYADYLVPELNISWDVRRQIIVEEIKRHIPESASFVVIDGDQFDLVSAFDDRMVNFLAASGIYGDVPVDDREALAVLEEYVRAGRRYLVIVRPAYWWIDNYIAFRCRLFEEWTSVCATSSVMIYRHSDPPGVCGREPAT